MTWASDSAARRTDGSHVVAEDEEGAAHRKDAAVAGHAGHGRAHGVLADPVVDLVALGMRRRTGSRRRSSFTPVLPVRSADPATRPGITSAVAVMHWLTATRVASFVPTSNTGSFSAQPSSPPPRWQASHVGLVAVPGVEARLPRRAVRPCRARGMRR